MYQHQMAGQSEQCSLHITYILASNTFGLIFFFFYNYPTELIFMALGNLA